MPDRFDRLVSRPDAEQHRAAIGRGLAKRLVRRHGSATAALRAYDTWSSASVKRSIKATNFEWDAKRKVREALIDLGGVPDA